MSNKQYMVRFNDAKNERKTKNRKIWRFRAIMEVFWTNIFYIYQLNTYYIS